MTTLLEVLLYLGYFSAFLVIILIDEISLALYVLSDVQDLYWAALIQGSLLGVYFVSVRDESLFIAAGIVLFTLTTIVTPFSIARKRKLLEL